MAQSYPGYGAAPPGWAGGSLPGSTPQFFVPQARPLGADPVHRSRTNLEAGDDPSQQLLGGVAGSVLRQQGETYLRRGRSWLGSLGFLGSDTFQAYFAVTPEYVGKKILTLLFPFARSARYARRPEHLTSSGAPRLLPPREDPAAPDLYIPIVAAWTFCVLIAVRGTVLAGGFGGGTAGGAAAGASGAAAGAAGAGAGGTAAALRGGLGAGLGFGAGRGSSAALTGHSVPEAIALAVSRSFAAWAMDAAALRVALWYLGTPSGAAPALLVLALAGYAFVPGTLVLLVKQLGLGLVGHAVWAYASIASAAFLVRSLKRLVFADARGLTESKRRKANYALLALALAQFPFLAWLTR